MSIHSVDINLPEDAVFFLIAIRFKDRASIRLIDEFGEVRIKMDSVGAVTELEFNSTVERLTGIISKHPDVYLAEHSIRVVDEEIKIRTFTFKEFIKKTKKH